LTHRRRSPRVAVSANGARGVGEGNVPTRSIACTAEHLVKRWPGGILGQAGEQVLLQRLARLDGSASQHAMDIVRDVLDLNAGHARSLAPFWRQNM